MLMKLSCVVINTLIPIFGVTIANCAYGEQPLSQKYEARSGDVKSEIRSLNQVQSPKTSATYLLRTPRDRNFVPQLNGSRYNGGNPRNALPRQVTSDVVSVTDVKVNTTDKGIELILVTANSNKLQVRGKTEGNSYIADIPNAKLQLASGESFRSRKPIAGITEVTVASVDANTLRVTVVGETGAPAVELFDSTQEGLVFGVSAAASIAQQPTTTPEQKRQTEQKQPPIELVVTASPNTYSLL